jgi:BirA family biotin operon repressor/biotin-[acetyl-CoA-carboxylase] ligase
MNERTERVLELLRRGDDYLSGEQIGRRLGISRSAVWKHVRELKAAGYGIVSSPKKGYGLRVAANVPLAAEVAPHLKTSTLGRRIDFHDAVDSTNRAVGDLARQGGVEGTVVVADAQTAGRGRMGRHWESPAGENLYFSILLNPNVEPARVPQLALVAAVALHEGLAECCPEITAQIKWPNDILVGGRKVAGILCEASLEADRVHRVILGVGINVNGTSLPRSLRATATSLRIAGGREVSRPELLAAALNRLEARYEGWLRDGSLSGLLDDFDRHSALNGRAVAAENLSGVVRGTARGITRSGELVLETSGGALVHLLAGDVHLLPLGSGGEP